MKVSFKYGIRTISGKLDDLVHMACNKGRVAVARVFVYPKLVTQHLLFGDINHNIASIWEECSDDFKADMKAYALQRIPYYTAEQIPAYANYAHFVRFLYNFSDENPEVDLSEITKANLELEGCPTTVAEIIVEEYLPAISDDSEMTNGW